MKKFLLSVAAAALSFGAYATTVEFDLTNMTAFGFEQGEPSTHTPVESLKSGDVTITVKDVTDTDGRWNFWTNASGVVDFRCTGTNAGSTLTFTAPENIVKIEFEGKAVAFKEVTNKVWTGDAKEAVLEATGKNQLSKCVVTYGEAPAPVEPETPVEPAGEGTLESPYNVAKALPLAEALDATGKVEGIYVKGYIVSIKEISTSYGNATYYIGDTPTSTTTLYVFRGKGLDGAKFTSESELVVGAEVVISGDLANYNGTSPQVNTGSSIVSYKAPAGTLDSPYTAAEALAIAKGLDADTQVKDVYVKGKIFSIGEINTQYGNATYTIGDSEETAFSIFRGKWFNGEAFTAEDQLKVGDDVVVFGTIVNYKGETPQMTTGSQIVEYNGVKAPKPEEPEAVAVKSVKETIAQANAAAVKIDYALTVGWVYNRNVFVCDEAGDFIQIYGENSLKVGDVIPAGWEGTYKLFNNVTPEIELGTTGLPAATAGTFEPKTVAAADVTTAMVNSVIKINDVVIAEATPAADADKDSRNFTGTVGNVTLSLRNNYALESVDAGTYNLTVVVTIYNEAPSLYVTNFEKTGSTGIEAIEAAAGEAEYFNLQGVRVANPENGLYIRRQGGKAVKVLVK